MRDSFVADALTVHGAQKSSGRDPRYARWSNIKQRCYNPNNPAYEYYGARGIAVCDRWRFGEDGVSAFECFLHDIGPSPGEGYSLDRVDTDGHYDPSNVRWATAVEQRRNRRDFVTGGRAQ